MTWTLVLLVACLRFAHSRRSHSLRYQDGFIRATCSQGKRRIQGRRPPFDWAIPARLTQSVDVSSLVLLDWAELQRALGKPPSFLVPDLEVTAALPLSSTTRKLPRPMTLAKFNSLLRSLAASLGASPEEAAEISSYSLRRFMPTAGEVMQFAPFELQAVGNWVELPRTEASTGARTPAVGMAQHYAHDKVFSAAFIKHQILTSLHQAMLKSGQPTQCTWHDVRLHVPPREAVLQHLQTQGSSQASPSRPTSLRSPVDSSSVSLSDSNSSSSDSETEVHSVDTLPWFTQSGKGQKHLVQKVQGNMLVPWCRDSVFAAVHYERGAGISAATELCQKCLARAPLAWREACKIQESVV